MTWLKLTDNALDDPGFLELPRGDRLLHLEALAWSNRHATGGRIPRAALVRLTDEEDPEAAAERLVATGIWEDASGGWQLCWLLPDQPTPDEIARRRELNRQRQERYRNHRAGDHTFCDRRRCKALSNGVTRDSDNGVSDATPTRPDPTPSPRGGSGKGQPRAGGAAETPPTPDQSAEERERIFARTRAGLLADGRLNPTKPGDHELRAKELKRREEEAKA